MSENDEGFFQIPYQRVSRDDIRLRLKIDKTKLSDAALSNKFMQEVANQMGQSLIDESWWVMLGEAIESASDSLGIDFESGTKCIHCGSYDIDWLSTNTDEDQSIKIEIRNYYCNACDKYFNMEV